MKWWEKESITRIITTYNAKFAWFYNTREWKQLRAAKITETPECEHCWLNESRVVPAYVVDHVIPLEEDFELRLVWDNLQCLCDRCHRVKTAKDTHARKLRKKLRDGQHLMDDLES